MLLNCCLQACAPECLWIAWSIFVRVTKILNALRQKRSSKTAYTRVIDKDTRPQEYLQQDDSSYEAMRKARCQLGCVAMLLWR